MVLAHADDGQAKSTGACRVITLVGPDLGLLSEQAGLGWNRWLPEITRSSSEALRHNSNDYA